MPDKRGISASSDSSPDYSDDNRDERYLYYALFLINFKIRIAADLCLTKNKIKYNYVILTNQESCISERFVE